MAEAFLQQEGDTAASVQSAAVAVPTPQGEQRQAQPPPPAQQQAAAAARRYAQQQQYRQQQLQQQQQQQRGGQPPTYGRPAAAQYAPPRGHPPRQYPAQQPRQQQQQQQRPTAPRPTRAIQWPPELTPGLQGFFQKVMNLASHKGVEAHVLACTKALLAGRLHADEYLKELVLKLGIPAPNDLRAKLVKQVDLFWEAKEINPAVGWSPATAARRAAALQQARAAQGRDSAGTSAVARARALEAAGKPAPAATTSPTSAGAAPTPAATASPISTGAAPTPAPTTPAATASDPAAATASPEPAPSPAKETAGSSPGPAATTPAAPSGTPERPAPAAPEAQGPSTPPPAKEAAPPKTPKADLRAMPPLPDVLRKDGHDQTMFINPHALNRFVHPIVNTHLYRLREHRHDELVAAGWQPPPSADPTMDTAGDGATSPTAAAAGDSAGEATSAKSAAGTEPEPAGAAEAPPTDVDALLFANEALPVPAEVFDIVSKATQVFVRELVASLALVARHRVDEYKDEPGNEVVSRPKEALRAFNTLDKELFEKDKRRKLDLLRKGKGTVADMEKYRKELERDDAKRSAQSANQTSASLFDSLMKPSSRKKRPAPGDGGHDAVKRAKVSKAKPLIRPRANLHDAVLVLRADPLFRQSTVLYEALLHLKSKS